MDSKLPGIQVGRAIPAISVFYFHSYIGLTYFDKVSLHTFDWLAVQGGSGVDLFFAISGFIVCYVAARPDFTTGSFLLKRFFRIYPLNALVTLIVAAICFANIRISDDTSFSHIIWSILILPQKAPVNSVGWTLEYEVAFYLVAAILLPRGGPAVLLAYCAASYELYYLVLPESPFILRFVTEHHAAFGAGVLAFMIITRLPVLPIMARWLLSAALAAAGVAVFLWAYNFFNSPLIRPAACMLAVIGAALLPSAPRWAVRLGDISYGFYLLHWPVVCISYWTAASIVKPNPAAGELWRWGLFLVVLALANLSWVFFEKPLNRMARRLTNRTVNSENGVGDYVASSRRTGIVQRVGAAD